MQTLPYLSLIFITLMHLLHADVLPDTLPPLSGGAPQTVEAMWAGFDPQAEPLDTEILKEWEEDGVTLQIVRFRVGIFEGEKAMMAGVYGYPTGQTNLPALVQIHGGGQFATVANPLANGKRGYATLSISREGRISAPNYFINNDILKNVIWAGNTEHSQYRVTTDWAWLNGGGRYVGGGVGLATADSTIDDVDSPRNSSWFLWAMAARRGLTFLEQQPEVDGDRLGVYGHSMGGKLTVMTAGSDDRVKMAAASCGGVSDRNTGNALYDATIADPNSLAGISCPIFFLKPANDFHAAIEDVVLALDEIQSTDWRVHHSPHKNHQDFGEYEVATQIWMDQHLKSGMTIPATPSLVQSVKVNGVPTVTVTVDSSRAVQAVEVYYTQMGEDTGEQQDPYQDNSYRHWHYSAVQGAGDTWTADLPILSPNEPLWVYANVTYALDAPISSVGYYDQDYTTEKFVLSTPLTMLTSAEVQAANIVGTLSVTTQIEDFQGDWAKEWFDNTRVVNDWAITTHKVNEPVYEAPALAKLSLEVKSADANTLLLTMNDSATVSVELPGGTEWQNIELFPMQFEVNGYPWAYGFSGGKRLRLSSGSDPEWSGSAPEFRKLQWVQATQADYDAFGPPHAQGEYVQRNGPPNIWSDWMTVSAWYSESGELRVPSSNDWARIHYNRHTFLTDAQAVARLDMYFLGGADLRIDHGGTLTVSTAGGFDGSINLSGSGPTAGDPNTGDISIETGGSLISGNTGTRTVFNGDSSQLGSLTLNGGTFTAQGSSEDDVLTLSHSEINLNSGTFDMLGGQTMPDGVVFNINGEGTDINFWLLNSAVAANDYDFTLDANGVSTINCTGWAHLSQANIVVDGANYTGGAQDIILFATPDLSSTVNPANISVINFPEWATVTVEQDDVITHNIVLHIYDEVPPASDHPVIVQPISVTELGTGLGPWQTSLGDTINNAGLSFDLNNDDAVPETLPEHRGHYGNGVRWFLTWLNNAPDGTELVFALDGAQDPLTSVILYNYYENGAGADRGFASVDVYTSTNGTDYTLAETGMTFAEATLNGSAGLGQTVDFSSELPAGMTHIKFANISNHGGDMIGFNEIRFVSEAVDDFADFISDPVYGIDLAEQGLADDPDGDGIPNGMEAWFGTHPGAVSAGLSSPQTDGTITTLTHPINTDALSGLTGFYQWSLNLSDWYVADGAEGPVEGATVSASTSVEGSTGTITFTASGPLDNFFLRAAVTQ